MPKVRKKLQEAAKVKPNADWFRDRMSELALDQKDAEKVFGTYRAMIWRMVTGQRPPRPEEIIIWAKFLRVPVLECMRRFGYDVPVPSVSVIGAIKSNGRVSVFPPAAIEQIEAPVDASENMRALIVEAPQTGLQLFDGTYLYYEPSKVVNPAAYGKLAVLEIGDISAPVIGVLYRISARSKKVEVYGGRERFDTEQLISAAPVLWQRSA